MFCGGTTTEHVEVFIYQRWYHSKKYGYKSVVTGGFDLTR